MTTLQSWIAENPPAFAVGQKALVAADLLSEPELEAIIVGMECSERAEGYRGWAYMVSMLRHDGSVLEYWLPDDLIFAINAPEATQELVHSCDNCANFSAETIIATESGSAPRYCWRKRVFIPEGQDLGANCELWDYLGWNPAED